MTGSRTITRIFTRFYSDNRQLVSIVEWGDGSRTEGSAYELDGIFLPKGEHMGALFDRALSQGIVKTHEVW